MCFFFIPLADERDAIQKKTFTKWINKHLKKVRHKFVFHDKYLAATVFLENMYIFDGNN